MALGGLKTTAGVLWACAALAISSGQGLAADLTDNMGGGMKDTAQVNWWDAVKLSGHVDVGITGNPDNPANNINFGRLFDDRANTPLLNQLLLTAERPLDTKLSDQFQVGFKLQVMYGSDARYTHFLGELTNVTTDRNQLDIVENYLNFHLPVLTKGGVDVKVGQYVTLEGAEVINSSGNFFYSHSYIFNFGTPLKHTGVLTTTHVNDTLDIYAGVDSGVNTSLGCGTTASLANGDNNCAAAFHGGFGLNLLKGDLTILATTHIGPETSQNNNDLRYLHDVTAIYKATKQLTFTTDANYITDEAAKASGWGVAQYATYQIDDNWSVGVRGEVWRDDKGSFVAAYPGSLDAVKSEAGVLNAAYSNTGAAAGTGKPTTYTELTFGANYKPTITDKTFEGLVIRPEVRWDWAAGSKPFNDLKNDNQFTAAIDVIIPFTAQKYQPLK